MSATVYVCACHRTFEFMSLAVICAESHPVGVAVGLTAGGREAAPVIPARYESLPPMVMLEADGSRA